MCSRHAGPPLELASKLAELRNHLQAEAARRVAAEAETETIRVTMVSACMTGIEGALRVYWGLTEVAFRVH